MAILSIHPDSHALVHAAAAAVLYLHIGAGSVGILSGTAAFIFRKGTDFHRLIGKVFVTSMLLMSAIGACVAPFLPTPERASMVAGVLTFYLVLTSWMTVKRKPLNVVQTRSIDFAEYGMLLTSTGVTAAGCFFFWQPFRCE